MFLGACQTKRAVPDLPPDTGVHIPRPELKHKPDTDVTDALPRGVVYRTSGNYDNNVAVILDNKGELVSYPAPTDVTAASAPLKLENGWLLDRRGIAVGAVFLSWTYAEYHAMRQAPTPAQIKAHILPGATVTELMRLPYTPAEALADTAAVNGWIRAHTRTVTLQN